MEDRFDLIIIGGGPGGYTAAGRAARLGLKTALVEARELGGTCLHRGCIPTKAMLHVAEMLRAIRQGEDFGIHTGRVELSYQGVLDYRKVTVEKLTRDVEGMLRSAGVAILRGRGCLCSGRRVQVTALDGKETVIETEKILLATGSRPKRLPIPGMELPGVLDSDGVFALEALPESLAVIGGGVIGAEIAEAFSAMGVRITLVEAQSRILPEMDRECSQSLRMLLKKRGVELHVGAALQKIVRSGEGWQCIFMENGKELAAEAQQVLCAVGRKPDTEGLFSGEERPLLTAAGQVKVDENFQTSLPGVYAIGDLIPGWQLAHVAGEQGKAVAEILAGRTPAAELSVIPRCVYTSPEIAEVGLSEREAMEKGITVHTGKALTGANGKSVIRQSARGFIKVVAAADTGKILGAQLMCEHATDIISEFTVAIVNGLTAGEMLRAVRPHPTFEEAVGEALERIYDR